MPAWLIVLLIVMGLVAGGVWAYVRFRKQQLEQQRLEQQLEQQRLVEQQLEQPQ